jgi:predicted RNase H-like nuclease (RuvC/YqgF family)
MADISSKFWERITTWLVKSLWPWIIKYIWPGIQKKIINAFILLIDNLIENISTASSDKKHQEAEDALKRAAEADKKAETAKTKNEAEAYHELAKSLREMADHYEHEIKDLRQKLDSLAAQSAEKFKESLDNLNLDEIIQEENGKLIAEGKPLPPLPPPNN